MKYLFSNKEVKVGDICVALCLKEHVPSLKLEHIFEKQYNSWPTVGRIGIKVIWTSKTRCHGYLVYISKELNKPVPYKIDNQLIYITFNTGNNIGLMKYIKEKI